MSCDTLNIEYAPAHNNKFIYLIYLLTGLNLAYISTEGKDLLFNVFFYYLNNIYHNIYSKSKKSSSRELTAEYTA